MEKAINQVMIPKKKMKPKKIIGNIIYYVVGAILSLIFLFPLIYMIATSTKTEAQNAFDAGTIYMFLPNFDLTQTFNKIEFYVKSEFEKEIILFLSKKFNLLK